MKRTFCPPPECYDPKANRDYRFGRPLPSFQLAHRKRQGVLPEFPIGMNPGLAKALGVMMKLDFERAVLNRVPMIEAHTEQYFRQVLFMCDEYQHFATVGENEPTGDEKFFSLSRQPKCIPIIATQSISSLKSALPGETWRTLLQTFRTKIFLALSDDFSARTASELCGREDQLKVSYNLSESGHDARVSLLTGKAISHKAKHHGVEELLAPIRLSLRHEDLHGTRECAVRRHRLRRHQSHAADVLLPEALLQRPQQILFHASCRQGEL